MNITYYQAYKEKPYRRWQWRYELDECRKGSIWQRGYSTGDGTRQVDPETARWGLHPPTLWLHKDDDDDVDDDF